jgi:adenosylmethionine-8-amino-7-oxononanoate aminotransferase
VANAREMGSLLATLLNQELGQHPNVGDIRGLGLFQGIELVKVKATSEPFPADDHVAMEIAALGLTANYCIGVYPGSGTADGFEGDHIIISPAYNVTKEEVLAIVSVVTSLIRDFFAGYAQV